MWGNVHWFTAIKRAQSRWRSDKFEIARGKCCNAWPIVVGQRVVPSPTLILAVINLLRFLAMPFQVIMQAVRLYLEKSEYDETCSKDDKREIRRRAKQYFVEDGVLFHRDPSDGGERRRVIEENKMAASGSEPILEIRDGLRNNYIDIWKGAFLPRGGHFKLRWNARGGGLLVRGTFETLTPVPCGTFFMGDCQWTCFCRSLRVDSPREIPCLL